MVRTWNNSVVLVTMDSRGNTNFWALFTDYVETGLIHSSGVAQPHPGLLPETALFQLPSSAGGWTPSEVQAHKAGRTQKPCLSAGVPDPILGVGFERNMGPRGAWRRHNYNCTYFTTLETQPWVQPTRVPTPALTLPGRVATSKWIAVWNLFPHLYDGDSNTYRMGLWWGWD